MSDSPANPSEQRPQPPAVNEDPHYHDEDDLDLQSDDRPRPHHPPLAGKSERKPPPPRRRYLDD